jgi:hypothetical protein
MIDMVTFGALGFLLGCLLALVLAAPLWNRAVRLTTRKLEATMPISLADIQADKDQLRAEFAIELRKVEVALEKAKEKAIRELIESNKRRVEIQMLQNELTGSKSQLQENENANRVLQQTIKRRLPDLDTRLKAAKKALVDLEAVNTELRATVASQSEALKTARATLHSQRADIDRLRAALESGSSSGLRLGKSELRAEAQKLHAALSRAQEDLDHTRTSAEEYAFMRRELSRLASQILQAARMQAPVQPQAVARVVEEEFVAYEPVERSRFIEPRHATNGANGNGHHAEPAGPAIPAETVAAIEEPMQDYQAESVESAQEPEMEPQADAEAVPQAASDGEARGSFAKRFAARRERRRAAKTGGSTLGARLRGLAAEAPPDSPS